MTDVIRDSRWTTVVGSRSSLSSPLRHRLSQLWAFAESSRDAPCLAIDYALALLLFAAALWMRIGLDAIIAERLLVITFFPAVLLAAYFCSLWSSILVLLLCAVAAAVWATTPEDPLTLRIASFILFVGLVGITLLMIQNLRRSLARIKEQDQHLALINRELKHRVKNLFAITNSICSQTMKLGGSAEEMSGRIRALAAAQDFLTVTASEGAELHDLIRELVGTLAPQASRLRIDGPSIVLPADVTTRFALMLHELGTNALKHGCWSSNSGRVEIAWRIENAALHLEWREREGPVVGPPLREGLGSALIKGGLPNAIVENVVKADGVECRITLPLR